MKSLKLLLAGLVLTVAGAYGAHVTVQNARLWGPNGAADGKIVMFNNRMVFVDNNQPDLSFEIPKSDIRTARWEGGRLTIDVANPYSSSLGKNQNSVVLLMPDPGSASTFVNWMGVPVTGYTGEADRSISPAANPVVTDISFDVKNGDQKGRLIVQPNELRFESLTDAKHSRHWRWADIQKFSRNGHEIKLEPYHGDKYEFQFHNQEMLQTAYDVLADHIVNARVNR